VLLDRTPEGHIYQSISHSIECIKEVHILDLHIWRLGPGHHSAILSLATQGGESPEFFKERLCRVKGLSDMTIEINATDGQSL
jgi:Co/Zn/Cd efflux system component